MQFQEECHYACPADTLLQVFSDKEFFLAKYRLSGASNICVQECEDNDADSRIRVSRDVAVDVTVPAFARRYIPQKMTVIQTDSWDHRQRTGQIQIELKGLPASIFCSMYMDEVAGGTKLTLNFIVRVNLPLIGKRLARLLANDIREKFGREVKAAQVALDQIVRSYREYAVG